MASNFSTTSPPIGLKFIVKNINTRKTVNLFGLKISPGASADNIEYVGTSSTGRWHRIFGLTSSIYQLQNPWYIDSVAGNDENVGNTSNTALKTARELKFRIGGLTFGGRTINILNDLPSSDPITLEGTFGGVFSIVGAKKILASGTFTADGYNETASTNTPPSATDSSRTWTSFVGNHIRVTSGAANNRLAVILKDTGSGIARTSIWTNPSSLTKDTPPASGDTYDIIDFVDIGEPIIRNYTPSTNNDVSFVDCKFKMLTGKAGKSVSILPPCRLYGSLVILNEIQTVTAYGVSISGPSAVYTSNNSYLAFRLSGIINAPLINNLVPFDNSIFDVRNTILQTGGIINGRGLFYLDNVGLFDVAGTRAILISEGSFCRLTGNLFGTTTATSAVELFSGARLHIGSSITPTLNGGTRQLLLDGTTSHIPPLSPSAVVPALATITSWAEWVASPFSRVFFSKRGTAVTNEQF